MALTEEAFDGLAKRLLADAVGSCCMNDEWRGRACPYHQGFEDGMDVFFEALRNLDSPEANPSPAPDG